MKMMNSNMNWDYIQNWSISPHMEIVARLLVRMQLLILKTVGIKWNSCRKVKLRSAGNVPHPQILAIALGVATMKKWQRKPWFGTCLNTYRLVLKYRHKREDEVVRKDITEEPEFIEVDPIEGEQVITEDAGQQEFPIEG